MAHRTQITLTDEQYERLRQESARTGLGLAELVRRALDATLGSASLEDKLRAIDRSFGAWRHLDVDGAEYVERIRPGLGRRLEQQ